MTQGAQTTIRTEAVKLTNAGQVRDHNEDFVAIEIPGDAARRLKGALYLVADGMGGYQAGEVASQQATEVLIAEYYADADNLKIDASLTRAVHKANGVVHEMAQANLQLSGMGTTLVAAVVRDTEVHVANVGDSRAYLLRGGQLVQITTDHSFVQEQIEAGIITAEAARTHPQRNVITRALGHKPQVEVDTFEGELAPGDALLLCSDGLSGPLRDKELAAILQRYPPQQAIVRLIEMANERGGPDNISAVVLCAQAFDPARPAAVQLQPGVQPLTVPPSQASVVPARAPVLAGLRGRVVVLGLLGALLAVVVVMAILFALKGDGDQTPVLTQAIIPTTPAAVATMPVTLPSSTSTRAEGETAAPTGTAMPPTSTGEPTKTPTNTPVPMPTVCQPVMPVLQSPQPGAQLTVGDVTFQWSGGSLCAGDLWLVRIDEQAPDFCNATTENQVVCSLSQGQHQWRVEAWRDGYVLSGAATSPLSFNIVVPASEPTSPGNQPPPPPCNPGPKPPQNECGGVWALSADGCSWECMKRDD